MYTLQTFPQILNLRLHWGRCNYKRVGPFFVTVLLDLCEAVDDMMCKYMEIIYESVLWAKKM
jgi:hypothetical protein